MGSLSATSISMGSARHVLMLVSPTVTVGLVEEGLPILLVHTRYIGHCNVQSSKELPEIIQLS